MDQRGILGNSRLLVVEDNSASWLALFYPHIGQSQNLNVLRIAILAEELKWLTSKSSTVFEYVEGTNILRNKHRMEKLGVEIRDFILPNDDVAIRRILIQNKSQTKVDTKLLVHGDLNLKRILHKEPVAHDKENENAVYSDGELFISFSGLPPFDAIAVNRHEIDRLASTHGHVIGWNLPGLRPGEKKEVGLIVVLGTSHEEMLNRMRRIGARPLIELEKECKSFWECRSRKSRIDVPLLPWMSRLLTRSSLLLGMLVDHAGGAIASPDTRVLREKGDTYNYVWLRDSAFTAMALDELGFHASTRRFFDFAERCQSLRGDFPEKCLPNGVTEEAWRETPFIQLDQTGLIIHSAWHHYVHSGDKNWLSRKWGMIESATVFLDEFRDRDGLPFPSYDLWGEERGVHIFSTACVYAGLNSASKAAGILREEEKEKHWRSSAENLREQILESMYDEERGYLIRRLSPRDRRVDASSLFAILFNMVAPDSGVARGTIKAIEDELTMPGTLGVARYAGDNFKGEMNPWIISTLWLADAHLMTGDLDKAETLARWCASQATTTGLLPEQVDRSTGKPLPPIPYTWSHAAYLRTALHLTASRRGLGQSPR